MKFEKINSDKFAAFRGSEISNLQNIVGGYRGETLTRGGSDQIARSGAFLGPTGDASGQRNDGYDDGTWENN